MNNSTFISNGELKLLLAAILFAFVLIFSSLSVIALDSYNAEVAKAEARKNPSAERYANDDFHICTFGATYPNHWSRFFCLAFLPACFFLVRRKRLRLLFASFALLVFPLFNFWCWFTTTLRWESYGENFADFWTHRYLYQSNSFDLLLGGAILILAAWHFSLLCRLCLNRIMYHTNLP